MPVRPPNPTGIESTVYGRWRETVQMDTIGLNAHTLTPRHGKRTSRRSVASRAHSDRGYAENPSADLPCRFGGCSGATTDERVVLVGILHVEDLVRLERVKA